MSNYSNFIWNFQKLEKPRYPSRWMDKKLWCIHMIKILFSDKSKWVIKVHKDISAYYKVKESNMRRQHTVYMKFWEMHSYKIVNKLVITSCSGLGRVKEEGWTSEEKRNFWGQWNYSAWKFNGGCIALSIN